MQQITPAVLTTNTLLASIIPTLILLTNYLEKELQCYSTLFILNVYT